MPGNSCIKWALGIKGVHHENSPNHDFFRLMIIFCPKWFIWPHAYIFCQILPYIITVSKDFEIESIVCEKKLSNIWKRKSSKFASRPPFDSLLKISFLKRQINWDFWKKKFSVFKTSKLFLYVIVLPINFFGVSKRSI